jgi:hypothetical protein
MLGNGPNRKISADINIVRKVNFIYDFGNSL